MEIQMARRLSRLSRTPATRSFIRQIHIYTEGCVTEAEYLTILKNELDSKFSCRNKFKIKIKPSKGKSSPKNIHNTIKRELKDFEETNSHEIWVLIDKDNWPQGDIDNLKKDSSISRKVSKFHVLVSDPKFELWLILHFENGNGIATATEIDQRLKGYMRDYDKHCNPDLFNLTKIQQASTNAKNLSKGNGNVCTDVYILIDHLLSLV